MTVKPTDIVKYHNAQKKALLYSRELPMRPVSPYGGLDFDYDAVKQAFRDCYEQMRKGKPQVGES